MEVSSTVRPLILPSSPPPPSYEDILFIVGCVGYVHDISLTSYVSSSTYHDNQLLTTLCNVYHGSYYRTRLQYHCYRGHGSSVQRLLHCGVDRNLHYGSFFSPLLFALWYGHHTIIPLLCNADKKERYRRNLSSPQTPSSSLFSLPSSSPFLYTTQLDIWSSALRYLQIRLHNQPTTIHETRSYDWALPYSLTYLDPDSTNSFHCIPMTAQHLQSFWTLLLNLESTTGEETVAIDKFILYPRSSPSAKDTNASSFPSPSLTSASSFFPDPIISLPSPWSSTESITNHFRSTAYHPFWSTVCPFYWKSLPKLICLCNQNEWLKYARYNYHQYSLEDCGPAAAYRNPFLPSSSSSFSFFTSILNEGYAFTHLEFVVQVAVAQRNLPLLRFLLDYPLLHDFPPVLTRFYASEIKSKAYPSIVNIASYYGYFDILELVKDHYFTSARRQPDACSSGASTFPDGTATLSNSFRNCIDYAIQGSQSLESFHRWLRDHAIYPSDREISNLYTFSTACTAARYNNGKIVNQILIDKGLTPYPSMIESLLLHAIRGQHHELIRSLRKLIMETQGSSSTRASISTEPEESSSCFFSDQVCMEACRTQNMDIVRSIVQQKVKDPLNLLTEAVVHGSWDVLKYLETFLAPEQPRTTTVRNDTYNTVYPQRNTPLVMACNRGSIPMFNYLRTLYNFDISNDCLFYAVTGGHLHMLQYLLDTFPCTGWENSLDNLLYRAARIGNLAMIDYLLHRNPLFRQRNFNESIFTAAVSSSNVELLRYLVRYNQSESNGTLATTIVPVPLGITGCLEAIGHGSLSYLQYVHHTLGCPWDSKVYYKSCTIGSVPHLRYLYAQTDPSVPMDLGLCEYARYCPAVRVWLTTVPCPCQGKRCQS